jgi:L-ascorbate metabolism protein UlaG (beta-lactamase superfamily)
VSDKKFYLKEESYFEPLFNHWYAWSHLIPPVTAARHLVKTHLRIMRSFINNYQLHIMASSDASLVGAEFLNCSEDQLDDIQRLVVEIETECQDIVQLCDAIDQLDQLMRSHTSGESIDYIYPLIPGPLKGVVEIFMDMEHRASYRFIEPLLYRSKYYKPSLQSASFGLLSKVEERPFVLSTPRLPDENHLQVNAQFASSFLDSIFRARNIPLSMSEIDQLFSDKRIEGGLDYRELFTEEEPAKKYTPVEAGCVRLQYTGHAGFLIDTNDTAILIDPVIASKRVGDEVDLVGFSELPEKIDYICLTHNHQDHVNIESLLQLRHKTDLIVVPKNNGGSLADPSIRLMLKQFGFKVVEVDDLEELELPNGKITSIPFFGEHGDLNIRSKSAWYIELYGKKLFFGADSSNPDQSLYEQLGEIYPDVDILAIGMECVGAPYTWIYGALYSKPVAKNIKNSRRLNGSDSSQAFAMAKAFKAKKVLLYALGMEPCYKYFMGLEYDDESVQILESKKMKELCGEIEIDVEMMYGRKKFEFNAGLPYVS